MKDIVVDKDRFDSVLRYLAESKPLTFKELVQKNTKKDKKN
jgi:hypothetical protein